MQTPTPNPGPDYRAQLDTLRATVRQLCDLAEVLLDMLENGVTTAEEDARMLRARIAEVL